jgi:hypothetical protein
VSKVIPVVLLILLATIILCVGCAPAVAREDFDKVKGDLATTRTELGSTKNQLTTAQDQVKILQAQVAKLSAMSAYTIWYDQYYTCWYYGYTNFQYADLATFTSNFGAMIAGTNDPALTKAREEHLVSAKNFETVTASLPRDYKSWTKEETE